MAFLEVRFDDEIAYGSTAIPAYSTKVKSSAAGFERRNSNWDELRLSFDLATGIKKQSQLDALLTMFHAVKGRAIGFRFKDWSDFTSKGAYETPAFDDQLIFGPAVGGETEIQLIKTYTVGTESTVRTIRKPVLNTTVVGVGPLGAPVELGGAAFSVDTTTGIITLVTPLLAGEYVYAGYEFDEAVRFDSDSIPIILDAYKVGNLSVKVVQVRSD
ncbi:MAG: DUF2460 domain-containing protein [Melioribacteraceae bacterium]|nr:DUF2460 domain-containing protein [Melioribacteraceae bacterium]